MSVQASSGSVSAAYSSFRLAVFERTNLPRTTSPSETVAVNVSSA